MPTTLLLREACLPSAYVALEQVRYHFAVLLKKNDQANPLTSRTAAQRITRGRKTGEMLQPRTEVQRSTLLLPSISRPVLAEPH